MMVTPRHLKSILVVHVVIIHPDDLDAVTTAYHVASSDEWLNKAQCRHLHSRKLVVNEHLPSLLLTKACTDPLLKLVAVVVVLYHLQLVGGGLSQLDRLLLTLFDILYLDLLLLLYSIVVAGGMEARNVGEQ